MEPCRAPRPPKDLPDGPLRTAWLEVAAAVNEIGSYARPFRSAFMLTVHALAAVYGAPADLKDSTRRGLMENASKLLARFGLDPVASRTIEVPPPPPEPDALDEFD